jgi:glycosyltransferase involved in cell wall biosynthesis
VNPREIAAVAAVTMVKDEADIIEATVAHMLTQVDYVVVADNLSTDGTRDILDRLAVQHPHLLVVDDPEVAYEQSRKMTGLANLAHDDVGADWVVAFDADEIWYSPFHDRVADHLATVADQWLVMPARVYDHVATRLDDPDDPDPTSRLGYRRNVSLPMHKVACRWRADLTIEMGNHGARYHGGATVHEAQLVVRHFPYRSVEQVIRKVRNGAAAYAASTLPDQYGAHWRQWGMQSDEWIAAAFHEWYYSRTPNNPTSDLIFDPAPVQRPTS